MAAAPQQQFQRSSSRLGFGLSSPARALRALRAPHAVSRSSGVVGCASVDEEPHGCGGFQKCGDDIGDFVVVNFYGWYAFVKPDLVEPRKKEPLLPGDDEEEEEEEEEDFMQVLANEHRSFLKRFDIKGRIYLSDTGINAQYSGPVEDALAYADFVKNWQPNLPHDDNRPFEHVRVSVQPLSEQAHAFPRCIVRVKNNLLPLAGGMADLDLCAPDRKAAELTPEQWEEKLKQAESLPEEQRPLLLDVRNAYEWDLGHFDGAARPRVDEFRDTPVDATSFASEGWDMDELMRLVNENQASSSSSSSSSSSHEDREILMYCTGGIRCDAYSAALRARGYKGPLYTLEGGVHNYFKQLGEEEQCWNGSLYVFDARGAVSNPRVAPNVHGPLTEDAAMPDPSLLPAAVLCEICGVVEAETPHTNCAFMDCNRHYLTCRSCRERWAGCCSAECETKGSMYNRLRPVLRSGNYSRMGKIERESGTALLRMKGGVETAERRRE